MTGNRTNPFLWQSEVNPAKLRLLDQWVYGNQILDIGCGIGAYARHLHDAGFSVTALDVEDRFQHKDAVRFVRARAYPLPLAAKCCDTMLLFDVLEHLDAEHEFLTEAARVTRKRLILSVPSDNDGELPRYGLCLVHHVDKTHRREYNKDDLGAALERAGFRLIHIEPSYPGGIPFVVREFFKASALGRVMRAATLAWLALLMKAGLLRVDLPADWLAVADAIEQ